MLSRRRWSRRRLSSRDGRCDAASVRISKQGLLISHRIPQHVQHTAAIPRPPLTQAEGAAQRHLDVLEGESHHPRGGLVGGEHVSNLRWGHLQEWEQNQRERELGGEVQPAALDQTVGMHQPVGRPAQRAPPNAQQPY